MFKFFRLPGHPQPQSRASVSDSSSSGSSGQTTAVLEPAASQVQVLTPGELLRREVDEEAIALPEICVTCTSAVQSRQKQAIEEEIGCFEDRLARTYAVEASYRLALTDKINQLKVERDEIELNARFKQIDMGFMKRRKWSAKHNLAVPRFAVFTIDCPSCEIEIAVNRRLGTWDREHSEWFAELSVYCSPGFLERGLLNLEALKNRAGELYRQASAKISRDAHLGVKVKLKASFSGVIPDMTRDKIEAARPLFDELCLVTEAPEWELNQEVFIPAVDPLVIGRKGSHYWLIDAFDLSALEESVKREWTADKLDG